jgi:hypothetical protein
MLTEIQYQKSQFHTRWRALAHGLLLANLLQSSRSTFSWGSLPSFFAFKEGMWDTQISTPLGSPTVSGHFVRQAFITTRTLPFFSAENVAPR